MLSPNSLLSPPGPQTSVPPHLSEFYQFVASSSQSPLPPPSIQLNPPAPSISSLTPLVLDLPAIITSKDRAEYERAIAEVDAASKAYEKALAGVSAAASGLGGALEALARLKGSATHQDQLMACSGLMYLILNHQQVLSLTVGQTFGKLVGTVKSRFHSKAKANDAVFNSELRRRVRALRQLESASQRIARSRTRNMRAYREALQDISNHIDLIDGLKHDYYESLLRLIDDANGRVVRGCGSVARAEFEIHENIARKGWSGGGMEALFVDCPDPFADDTESLSESESVNERLKDVTLRDSLFCTKVSSAQSPRVKPQLVNTKDALTDEIFSPISHDWPDSNGEEVNGNNENEQHDNLVENGREHLNEEHGNKIEEPDKSRSEGNNANEDPGENNHDDLLVDDDNSFSLPVPGDQLGDHSADNAWDDK